MSESLLCLENLKAYFFTDTAVIRAVDGVSYEVNAGETLAVVGESGSGKSVTALSILKLIPQPPGRIQGTLNGTLLEATWSQSDRSGRMRVQLAPDGRSFTGTWTEADGRGGGAWNGTRR